MLAVIEKKLSDHHETIAVLLRHISLENTEALYVKVKLVKVDGRVAYETLH